MITDERITDRLRLGAARYQLTPRMTEVALLAVQGASYVEIGRTLGVSQKTARIHVSRCYSRTLARNRVQLLRVLLGEPPRWPMTTRATDATAR